MEKKLVDNRGLSSVLSVGKREHIFPFTEKPSEERVSKSKEKNPVDAFGLFSLFTADIIKEDVIFTR